MQPWRSASIIGLSVLGAVLLVVTGTSSGLHAASEQLEGLAVANLTNVDGASVGVVVFTQQGSSVRVAVEVNGLPQGFHGFHVHAVGNCEPGTRFMSAGGHHNPGAAPHGDHAGDLPSLYVNADGSGSVTFTTDRFTVDALLDADGSALIIHADKDNLAHIPARYGAGPDEMTLATGDAGPRIACAVIEKSGRPAA